MLFESGRSPPPKRFPVNWVDYQVVEYPNLGPVVYNFRMKRDPSRVS